MTYYEASARMSGFWEVQISTSSQRINGGRMAMSNRQVLAGAIENKWIYRLKATVTKQWICFSRRDRFLGVKAKGKGAL
jgi:hypothetical protein